MTLTRRGRTITVLLIVVAIIVLGAGAAYAFLRSIGVYGSSDPGRAVEVVIPKGTSAEDIGKLLEAKGIIASELGWRIVLYMEEGDDGIQAGRYELFTGLTARDALRALAEGAPKMEYVTVTFPEGSWLTDFARILDRDTHVSGDRFLELVTEGGVRSELQPEGVASLEGLLFPSTYQVIERDTPRSIAARLVGELEEQVAAIDFSAAEARGLSIYEAIIVASMVEAEARVPEDRAKIAAVIYNRLDEGMPLGIDATVLYALGEHKEVLTESDLAVDSPYNTRVVAGLPPTPIGAVGTASLEAAAQPAAGDWLYFVVADCDGTHAFSTSYDDFLADKAAYQQLSC